MIRPDSRSNLPVGLGRVIFQQPLDDSLLTSPIQMAAVKVAGDHEGFGRPAVAVPLDGDSVLTEFSAGAVAVATVENETVEKDDRLKLAALQNVGTRPAYSASDIIGNRAAAGCGSSFGAMLVVIMPHSRGQESTAAE